MGTKGWQEQVAQWPGVESSVKWGDNLVFTVAGKMFCATRLDGPGQGSLSFKVEDDRFLELTGRPASSRRLTSPARTGSRSSARTACRRRNCRRCCAAVMSWCA